MVIGTARLVLRIPWAQSLKAKRSVMKPLIAQIQRQFTVSIAEVESQDEHQIGVLGIAAVSTDTGHADEVIARAVRAIERARPDIELVEFGTEIVHVL